MDVRHDKKRNNDQETDEDVQNTNSEIYNKDGRDSETSDDRDSQLMDDPKTKEKYLVEFRKRSSLRMDGAHPKTVGRAPRIRRGKVSKRRPSNKTRKRVVRRRRRPGRPRVYSGISALFEKVDAICHSASSVCLYCGRHCCMRKLKLLKSNKKKWKKVKKKRCRVNYVKRLQKRGRKRRRCRQRSVRRRRYRKKAKRSECNSVTSDSSEPPQSPESVPSTGSIAIQAGARCETLSPLYVNSNLPPVDDMPHIMQEQLKNAAPVSPEMILKSIQDLTKWKPSARTESILQYILKTYPVNRNKEELTKELREKLYIAAELGIISRSMTTKLVNDMYMWGVSDQEEWCLNYKLMDRQLTPSQVSKFWEMYEMYVDSIAPLQQAEYDSFA